MKYNILIVICIFVLSSGSIIAQTSGNTGFSIDTTFIFTSPRPLINDGSSAILNKNIAGIEFLLSNAGIGFGGLYERILNLNYKFTSEMFFSGMKNSDELEIYWNSERYEYVALNKIRRLYIIPLNIGLQRYINFGNLSKSFRPYVGIMATPTLIWEMPYNQNWFDDVKYSKAHYRIGAGIQIGADFGAEGTSLIGVKMRYVYTPFGGDGLESVKESPIKNFGGFYLGLTLSGMF